MKQAFFATEWRNSTLKISNLRLKSFNLIASLKIIKKTTVKGNKKVLRNDIINLLLKKGLIQTNLSDLSSVDSLFA